MHQAYAAENIFTGETWLTDHVVVCEDNLVTSVVPRGDFSGSVTFIPASFLVPAFIDLQIYGASGRLFAVYPNSHSLDLLVEYCASGGASLCLPTIATNTTEVVYRAIDAVRDYMRQGGRGILGIHLEGPWINAEKRGAHIASLVHPPSVAEVKALLEHGKGVIKMITLAPEVCTIEIAAMIRAQGIVISAGHSNATFAEAKQAFSTYATAVTHLFNAMSPFSHRAPGLAGATLDDANVMASIIPDGHHVDFAAIRVAKHVMGPRLFAITDAVTETHEGQYQHYLAGDKYEAGGILSGSALTMNKALHNLVHNAGIETGEALRMCSLYPAKVIGTDKEFGRIAPGYRVAMTALDENFDVKQLISY